MVAEERGSIGYGPHKVISAVTHITAMDVADDAGWVNRPSDPPAWRKVD